MYKATHELLHDWKTTAKFPAWTMHGECFGVLVFFGPRRLEPCGQPFGERTAKVSLSEADHWLVHTAKDAAAENRGGLSTT